MFPDFLGVGAQKAGTTWLYRNLQAHPEIWMPPIKELHYFDEKTRLEGGLISRLRGDHPADVRWRRQFRARFRHPLERLTSRDLSWDLKYFFGKPGTGWYASLFKPGRGRVKGEMTPDYAVLEKEGVARVHELMPDAKIIFMMRNPVERPWSVTTMGLRIRGRSMEDMTIRNFRRQFDRGRVRRMTDYLRTLDSWSAFYPEERIFAGFLEDIHFFPEETLRSLYRFLGIDPSAARGAITQKIHPGSVSEMPMRLAIYLARSYLEETEHLEERFGGYASFWRFCAEQLAQRPSKKRKTGQIRYPLWESELWELWEGARKISPQSGVLSSLPKAS
jgi:hypothetical protein